MPVGRVGAGEEIAWQILSFMANGFVTGAIVYIDGGALPKLLVMPEAAGSRHLDYRIPIYQPMSRGASMTLSSCRPGSNTPFRTRG